MNLIILKSTDSLLLTTSSQETATKIIDNLSITFISESTNSKLLKAIDILNESNNINKEIFLFSDFQESTFNNKNSNDSLSPKTRLIIK